MDEIKTIVLIKKVDTQEIRKYDGGEYPYLNTAIFQWSEGNYSCDCNRSLFFDYANDGDGEGEWDIPCSEGLFIVQLKDKNTNKVIYDEFLRE